MQESYSVAQSRKKKKTKRDKMLRHTSMDSKRVVWSRTNKLPQRCYDRTVTYHFSWQAESRDPVRSCGKLQPAIANRWARRGSWASAYPTPEGNLVNSQHKSFHVDFLHYWMPCLWLKWLELFFSLESFGISNAVTFNENAKVEWGKGNL